MRFSIYAQQGRLCNDFCYTVCSRAQDNALHSIHASLCAGKPMCRATMQCPYLYVCIDTPQKTATWYAGFALQQLLLCKSMSLCRCQLKEDCAFGPS